MIKSENTSDQSEQKEENRELASAKLAPRNKRHKQRLFVGVRERQCRLCQKPFWPKHRAHVNCSFECHVIYKNRKKDGTLERYNLTTGRTNPLRQQCAICSNVFFAVQKKEKCCSDSCKHRLRRDQAMKREIWYCNQSIEIYLKTRWKNIRNEVLRGGRRVTEFDLPSNLFHEIWKQQKGKCAISGTAMTHILGKGCYITTNASVDRIDNSKGYIRGNVRLVCRAINIMKHKMTDAELLDWCLAVIKNLPPGRTRKAG